MSNELAVVSDNWLELSGNAKQLPRPFEREIFLFGSHLAGTVEEIVDVERKSGDLPEGEELKIVVAGDAGDDTALEVRAKDGVILGWISKRWSGLVLRLLKAGKTIVCKYRGSELVEEAWTDVRVDVYMRDV